jgi:fumarate reductase subunit D
MKKHVIIWIIAIGLALGLGWVDHETTSWHMVLYNNGNAVSLLLFTLVFAGIGYSICSLLFKKP